MNRKQRGTLAVALVVLLLGIGALGLSALGDGAVHAAPAARPAQQGVQASGFVTLGQGTCFPDAVLTDCDGNITHQLKGPGGSGYFAPYYDQWVDLDGAEMTCVAGDKYIQVVSIQTAPNPCPGQGTPSATPTLTPTLTSTPVPGASASPTAPLPPGVTPTATSVVTGPVNLALGKAVQASSAPDAAHPPEHAVDGNETSFWASIPDPQPVWHVRHVQWIYVDLGAEHDIERMRMLWNEHARPRKYAVYVWRESLRGWDVLAWTENGKTDDTVVFPRDQLRYPKWLLGRYFMLWLEVPKLAGSNYELLEWEVYGEGTPIQSTNIAAGKPSLAQSHEAGYEAPKANDADLGTEWRSNTGLPQWIYVDLQATYEIDKAILRWVTGMHATSYGLYAWDGFSNWLPIYATSRGTGVDETVTFRSVRTRYLLLHATAGPANNVGLREFEIYQPRGTGVVPYPMSADGWIHVGALEAEGAELAPGQTTEIEPKPSLLSGEKSRDQLSPVPGARLRAASEAAATGAADVRAPDPTR
jgi:hypothetical protein